MRDDLEVPPQLEQLGRSLEPVWNALRNAFDDAPPYRDRPTLSPEAVCRHLRQVGDFTGDVITLLNGQLIPVLQKEDTPAVHMQLLARRLDKLIRRQLQCYYDVEASSISVEGNAYALLARIYRHNLEELRDWLKEVIDLTLYPEDYLEPGQSPHVTLHLDFTPAPEIEELEALMAQQIRGETRSLFQGFWGTVGAVVLGVGLAEWLFGKKDD